MFTDKFTAHASAAVEMQQVVSSDKRTLDFQVSLQGRPFCQTGRKKTNKMKICVQEASCIYQKYKSSSLREKGQIHGRKPTSPNNH